MQLAEKILEQNKSRKGILASASVSECILT